MTEAIGSSLAAQKAAAAERTAPAREQEAAALKADAALFGTPGWDALSDLRRARVAAHVRQAAQTQTGGGSDAA
jgi:hypothetical protein